MTPHNREVIPWMRGLTYATGFCQQTLEAWEASPAGWYLPGYQEAMVREWKEACAVLPYRTWL